MHIIDVIGYSGSGKTSFITKAINLIKKNLNCNVTVIKNVKHHPVDEGGKDSYRFTEIGANYSVIQNINHDTAIFIKNYDEKLEKLLKWLNNGPFELDVIFTEGFRNLNNPTVLCISNFNEIEEQLTENVKMISGILSSRDLQTIETDLGLPVVDIEREFSTFLKLFDIK
jgi:molybdopterin-guanine dinucleotide biosynthesis protein MobB